MFTAHVFRPGCFVFSLLAISNLIIFPAPLWASDPNDPPVQENVSTWLDTVITLSEPNLPPSISDWERMVQDSVSSRDYRPVLDLLKGLPNTLLAQQLYSQAKQIYENAVLSNPTSDDAFYAKKGLLFLQICRKDAGGDLMLEQFRTGFSDHPQLTRGLREAADMYYFHGDQFSKARDLYQEILNKASNDESMLSQRGLTMASIRLGDLTTASAAADRLLSVYGSDPQIALAVREVADAYYYYTDNHYKARELYQWIDQHGSGTESMWVHRGLVMTHLREADYAAADAALEKLRSDYASHPQIALALREAANAYLYVGNDPSKAREVYEQILRDCPEGTESMWAQRGLVLTALDLGDKATADVSLKKLLSNYTNHSQIAFAIRELADRYFYYANDPSRACALYQCILLYWPDSPEVMQAQQGLAMAKVHLGDNVVADAAADSLLSDFADHPELGERAAKVIYEYCRAGKYAEAITLSEKILNGTLNKSMELVAHTGLAQSYVLQKEEAKAQEQINLIRSKYIDQKQYAYSLFVIGEQYYIQGIHLINDKKQSEGHHALEQAVAVWDTVRAQTADPLHQAHAIYYSGEVFQKIGQYEKAMNFYRQLLNRWPAYDKAWYVHFQIAKTYEKLEKQGMASIEDIKSAYQVVLNKYPGSSVAEIAEKELKNR